MTNQEIIDRAKYLLEAEIDGIADPNWSQTMFEIWGKDSLNDLILKLKKELLEKLAVNLLKISSTILKALIVGNPLDSDCIADGLVSVTRNGKPCHITTVKKYLNNLLYTPSEVRPVCYFDNGKLFIQPAGDIVSVVVRYIASPTFEMTTESSLPINWQQLIPLYIVAKALEKDKQERSANFMKQFDDGIQVINATLK